MFNTFHFAIFAYQMCGRGIVNRSCTVNAVLGCPHLECVLYMPVMFFCKESCIKKQLKLSNKQKETIFICTTILFYHLFILHCILDEGLSHPLTIAIVEVMPRGRVIYSYKNKHSSSTLNTYQTDIFIKTIIKYKRNAFSICLIHQFLQTIIILCSPITFLLSHVFNSHTFFGQRTNEHKSFPCCSAALRE